MASVMLAAPGQSFETWPVHQTCEVRHQHSGCHIHREHSYIHPEIAVLTLSPGGPLAQWTRVCVSEAQSPVFEPRMVLKRWLPFLLSLSFAPGSSEPDSLRARRAISAASVLDLVTYLVLSR